MNNFSQKSLIPCSECNAGHMHRRFLTYLLLGDDLISVRISCLCGYLRRREYDLEALSPLSLLLNQTQASHRKVRQVRRSSAHKKASRPLRRSKSIKIKAAATTRSLFYKIDEPNCLDLVDAA